ATTDASGKFRIGSLPEGWLVSLDVNHPGFARWHESGIKVGRQDLKFVLVPSARITGRVVFEGTGQTAAGLRIECQQDSLSSGARFIAHARGTTDDKGCFLLDNLLPGNYSVFPVHYHEDDPEWAGLPKRAENLAEGGLVNCGDLVLTRGGFVAGKVTDRDTGKPLAGVSIMARLAHYSTFVEPRRANTKPDGTYKLRLAPAEWRIHVTGREGFISHWDERNTSRDVRVAPGQTTEGVDFTLGRGAELRGIVVDPRGRPVSKAIVRLGAIWSRATTKDDGTFSLHGLKPDQEVSLCAHSPDHALGAIVAVTPNRDHAEPIIIKLAPCVKMTGTVVDGNGKPIQEARVRVQQHISRPSSARWIMEIDSAQTDGQGRFALRLLPGTEHDLEAHAEGYGQARMPKLTVNREKDVGKLVLRKADAFIAGRVTDVEGNPILGAQVNAYGDGQPLLCRGITDSQGRYRIEPLVQGKVRVSVWCGNDSAHREDVPTGSQDVDLVLARREEPKAVLHAGQDG
ncbi:MAG: carboxypeptidase regulatory-like domain-containing protein, partial [Planctomycetes bacterium]|nr:carboxypeptidase regulatory-like domain-containing protein [Planctomycetota bacterium]